MRSFLYSTYFQYSLIHLSINSFLPYSIPTSLHSFIPSLIYPFVSFPNSLQNKDIKNIIKRKMLDFDSSLSQEVTLYITPMYISYLSFPCSPVHNIFANCM